MYKCNILELRSDLKSITLGTSYFFSQKLFERIFSLKNYEFSF